VLLCKEDEMNASFIVGERIYLRPLEEDDLDRCLCWINDGEILSRLGRRCPMSRTLEREWLLGQYKRDDHLNLAIVLKDGDRHIGNCGFNTIDYINRNAEFGILIGDSEAWGEGYGPEAARLILKHGFEELGLHRVMLEVYSNNPRAVRAYEKVGFVREGTKREAYFRNGRFHNTLVMGILRSEWGAK